MPAGALYARYVPPKPASKPVNSPSVAETVVKPGVDSHQDSPSRKRKRDDKPEKKANRKSSNLEVDEKRSIVTTEGNDATSEVVEPESRGQASSDATTTPALDAQPPKPPKRSKRQKTSVATDDGTGEATDATEDGDIAKRHPGVFAKFQKSLNASGEPAEQDDDMEMLDDTEQPILHDLVPIPMPEERPAPEAFSNLAALPLWLSQPLRVSLETDVSLSELVNAGLAKRLSTKGFTKALPVQAGVLPLLLPTVKQHPGDLCISAATGSGKTLAYVLPVIESIKQERTRKLRAVIVVPTRELVSQVRQTTELCMAGTDLKVGIAVGHHALKSEQDSLVARTQRFNPTEYERLQKIAHSTSELDALDDEDNDDFYDLLPQHVFEYNSNVDILICTPGRLVEHIKSTKGFTLHDLQWLIIDEADRLLDQSFQEWVEVIQGAITPTRSAEKGRPYQPAYLARNVGLRSSGWVRKVVLSATMTRDLDKLSSLRLRNPRLVLVEGEQAEQSNESIKDVSTGDLSLPATLTEHAIPAGDGAEKPLYLLKLLQQILDGMHESNGSGKARGSVAKKRPAENDSSSSGSSSLLSDSGSSSESNDDSDNSSFEDDSSISSTDSSDQDSASGSDSDSDPSSTASSSTSKSPIPLKSKNDTETPKHIRKSSKSANRNALIFVASNEAAARLAQLLHHLYPAYASRMASITKSGTDASTRKALSSFTSGSLSILIATDRASRGLDLPTLANVINYDMPHSITGYIHRVGRTARAGKAGSAWTLVADREAAWFWNAIARGKGSGGTENDKIERAEGKKLERVRYDLDDLGEEARQNYSTALSKLKQDVQGTKK